jgi:hypothetical protein
VLNEVSDEEFVRSLKQSHQVSIQVKDWLIKRGYDVSVKTTYVRPNFESRHDYVDKGDIILSGEGRIEVKYRQNLYFTDRGSYKYPTVFVDELRKIDKPDAEPLVAYIIVNSQRTHVAIIAADTRQKWTTIKRYDGRIGDHRRFCECPKEHVAFLCMNDYR